MGKDFRINKGDIMVKAIAIIGMRLLALSWMFDGLMSTSIYIAAILSGHESDWSIYYHGAYLFFGAFVWVIAPRISHYFCDDVDSVPGNVKLEEIVGAGSFLMGLYLFVTYIGKVIYQLNAFSIAAYGIGSIIMQVIQPIMVIILSLFLIFGHRRFIVNLFNFIRKADTKVYKVED